LDHRDPPNRRASVAYLAGLLRIGFGTYFEASMLAGLLCIAAALMVVFVGTSRRASRWPVAAPKRHVER
jgi:hypothetical protein